MRVLGVWCLLLVMGMFSGVKAQDSVSDFAIAKSVPSPLPPNADSLQAKIAASQCDFKTLSARIKMEWNDGQMDQEFMASVRIKKDSVIWMSLGMMGIEGMRLLVTPDSVRVLNKLANEYDVHDFSYLTGFLFFPVSFTMLQQIIAGGKISMDERAAAAGTEDSSLVLFLESDKSLEVVKVDSVHYTPQKLLLKDKLVKQDLAITFDRYNFSEAKPFSYQRAITIKRDETTATLHMEFTKLNFDEELSFPFEVNEKFKRNE